MKCKEFLLSYGLIAIEILSYFELQYELIYITQVCDTFNQHWLRDWNVMTERTIGLIAPASLIVHLTLQTHVKNIFVTNKICLKFTCHMQSIKIAPEIRLFMFCCQFKFTWYCIAGARDNKMSWGRAISLTPFNPSFLHQSAYSHYFDLIYI